MWSDGVIWKEKTLGSRRSDSYIFFRNPLSSHASVWDASGSLDTVVPGHRLHATNLAEPDSCFHSASTAAISRAARTVGRSTNLGSMPHEVSGLRREGPLGTVDLSVSGPISVVQTLEKRAALAR